MLSSLEQRIFMREAPRRVRYLPALDYSGTTPLGQRVIGQMARDFQVVTPITVHLSSPDLLAAVWALARETLVAGPLDRARREAIAAAVSATNACTFCVDVHTATLHATGNHALADRLRRDGTAETPDVAWASHTLRPGAPILASPPFDAAEAPQLIGTAVAFHYINRIVNVFLPDSPLPVPKFARAVGGRLFGKTFASRMVVRKVRPGDFLTETSAEPLPEAFGWAAANPEVTGAIARWSMAAEAAGSRSIPGEARQAVGAFVESWNGAQMPLDGVWLDEVLGALAGPGRAVARLALLTAVASYRVDDATARAVLDAGGERGLVDVVGWGAYRASRRIASWLRAPTASRS